MKSCAGQLPVTAVTAKPVCVCVCMCVNVCSQSCLCKHVCATVCLHVYVSIHTVFACAHPLTFVIYHQMLVLVCTSATSCHNVYLEIITLCLCMCVSTGHVCVLWCAAPADEIIWQSMEWQFDLLICVLLAHRESLSYSAAISRGRRQ